MSRPRHMHLAGFFSAGNVTHAHGAWRHVGATNEFLSGRYYKEIARTLERGKFDLLFLPDALAIEDSYGHNLETGVGLGGQGAIALEPTSVVATMAAATDKLGLGATVSTTYYAPYHVARVFATLDNLSDGRVSWNVVTSLNDSEARNFGVDEHLEHDQRYDRADEFLEAVKKLWASWSDDALLLNKAGGQFADPKRVRYADHRGTWLSVRGPLQVPRSRQGEPVILQAGLSPRGRRFAGRWAEAVFSISPNVDVMRATYADIKSNVAAAGRDPDQTKVFTAVMPILGETEAIANDRLEYVNSLVHPEVGLSTLSSHSGVDLSAYPLDTKYSDIVGDLGDRHVPTMLQMFSAVAGGADLTLAELGRRYGTNVGFVPQWAGTAEQIADLLVDHFEAGAADGFIISAAHLPGSYDEFVDQVVPLLQERGVFRADYEGTTLREHLGLDVPHAEAVA
ncbi:LLM class flavin-dependent oxidoreductase [Mycobacterium sp. SMC-18]|uniref:LLM class flavin-dependent oxidoreductase n=2 Tax=Mycobacteriaceae TaxID=1762 RepID=UPI001CFC3D06|nr:MULTISPECIES: LLM class flavin-dependent oxidoreductase [Mycolicibacterium]MDX1881102.1 LLM class flavin-dependent oxidoreductase [Mycolicibacterium sp. 141076]UCZ58891.1 LLM class flavin-dependent oxidoreductase [Mycolicibacterium phocaicum]